MILLEFEHATGITMAVDLSKPYKIKYSTKDSTEICGDIYRCIGKDAYYYHDYSFTKESIESLELRIEKILYETKYPSLLETLL